MNCQEAKEFSSEYLDQRLPPARVLLLEEHVRSCSDCKRQIEDLRNTVSLLGSLDRIQPSADFLDQVQRKIDEQTKPWRIWAWMFEPIRVKVPLEAAALILLSVGALHLYYRTPELSKEARIPRPLESLSITRDKPQEESVGKKRASERRNEITPNAPPAPATLEPQPSAAEARKEQSFHAQERAADVSRKSGAPASPRGSREVEEKSIDAQGRSSERDQIAKKEAAGLAAEPARAARDQMAASTKPETYELLTDDVDLMGAKIEALLPTFGGRLLTREAAPESRVLLIVELPEYRRTEFLAALKEIDTSKKEPDQKEGRTGGRAAQGSAPQSSLRTDAPRIRLQLRIIPNN